MRRWRGVALVLLLTAGCGGSTPPSPQPAVQPATPQTTTTTTTAPPDDVVLTFAGDVNFAGRTAALLDDPSTAFGPISQVFHASDVAVVNLETAVTTGGTPELKQFRFRAPPATYQAVKAAGVDAVTLANNHSLDYGPAGLTDTLRHARDAGVPTFGAGQNAAQAYAPWLTQVRRTRIAVLGISQVHELETSWNATDSRPGVAHARDAARSLAAVRGASGQADLVVVFMHWGKEGNACPTAEMRSFARQLADAGADLIVGTHAHLLLGDGWLGGTYVAYGLGNFLWWRNDAHSNDTGVLRVTLRDSKIANVELVPAYISRITGRPELVSGAEADRIRQKHAHLRGCAGLAADPS